MRVLFPALGVSHLDASLAFYTSVGFDVVGRVGPTGRIPHRWSTPTATTWSVQWPPGHPVNMTRADFESAQPTSDNHDKDTSS